MKILFRPLEILCRVIISFTLLIASLLPSFAEEKIETSDSAFVFQYLPPTKGYNNAVGIALYKLHKHKIGFYFNFSITLGESEPFYESLNENSFGDPVIEESRGVGIFNIGATYRPVTNLAVYLGPGIAIINGIVKKRDPTNILSSDGIYYTPKTSLDNIKLNFNVGITLILQKLVLDVGFNSLSKSMTVGAGITFQE